MFLRVANLIVVNTVIFVSFNTTNDQEKSTRIRYEHENERLAIVLVTTKPDLLLFRCAMNKQHQKNGKNV